MSVTAQTTAIRAAIKSIIAAEFSVELASDDWHLWDDKLHRALGEDGNYFGTSPNSESPWARDNQVLQTDILVQFYGKWDKEVDPKQQVDPAIVETYSERLKRRIRSTGDNPTSHGWYFNLIRVDYPDDPTGNKTRFEAILQGYGNNSVLVETTG